MAFHLLVGRRADHQRMLIILRHPKNGMSSAKKKVKILRKRLTQLTQINPWISPMKSETGGQEGSMRIEIVNELGNEIVDVIVMIVTVENAMIVGEVEIGMTVFVVVFAIVNVTETVKEGVIVIAIVMTGDVSVMIIGQTETSMVNGMHLRMAREEEVGLNHSNRNLTQPSCKLENGIPMR